MRRIRINARRTLMDKPDAGVFERYKTVRDLNIKAYDRIRREIRPGNTEKDLYDAVIDVYLSNTDGQAGYAGDYISGKRTCGIEGPATDKVLEYGDTVIVDALCSFNGAFCDTTRSFFCGEPSDGQKKAYAALCRALEETSRMLRPGVRACDVFFCMDGIIKEEGYAGLVHHAGHGLANSWYEQPYFIADCETVLEENMLVALEPGVYLEDKFGLRIENNFRVTENGGEDVFGYTTRLEDFIIG